MIKSTELDFPDLTTGYSQSFFLDFLESLSTVDVDSGSNSDSPYEESGDDPESHPESDSDRQHLEFGDDPDSDIDSSHSEPVTDPESSD